MEDAMDPKEVAERIYSAYKCGECELILDGRIK
jgi:hypothetical protein